MQVKVSDDATQYGVEAGRRGTVTFSHDRMVKENWLTETGIS